ncbi:hypothetical protein BKH43_01530 [Helicobacter sp. 13S00401-1]|uniref:dihydrolipoyl dehydrogenase family protein n=1 Tax=Helicobacter sp. 13S00401-1 TaxID=1905758 RepID=UPI000BA78E41|nr:FAD-dependent oxidoreductase [Helicobacter sp. 13S00401-1]PAF51347.1 hypothetical protein BKH43_01530 [Helicobacter sp. 13S00401-1]
MKKYDVAIIGAGPGGYSLAVQLGSKGKKVALIEKAELGGTCVNVGCIPTKSLITSARYASKNLHKYGVETSEALLNIKTVASNAIRISKTLNGSIAKALEGAKVELYKGKSAKFVDAHTLDIEGEKIEASKIVIATGGRNNTFNIENADLLTKQGKLLYSTEALRTEVLPKKLVIIGSGIISLEFAYYFAAMGSEVTMLEFAPKPFPSFDRDVASEIEKSLSGLKVSVRTNVKFIRFNEDLSLEIEVEGKKEKIEADKFLAAVGRRPNSELAQGIVDIDERGNIKINDANQTSLPHIYAMGDVTGKKPLSSVSYKHADTIYEHIMGKQVDVVKVDHIPTSVYIGVDIAGVGKSEERLLKEGIPYKVLKVSGMNLPRLHAEQTPEVGLVKLLIDEENDRLLGAHLVLKDASLVINTLALAVSDKIKLRDLYNIGYTHPSVAEAIYYALRPLYL